MKRERGDARTLNELAVLLGGELVGEPHLLVRGVGGPADVKSGEIMLVEDERRLPQAMATEALALVVPARIADSAKAAGKPFIAVANPRLAFARLLELFASDYPPSLGVHPTAVVSRRALLGKNVSIQAHAVVEAGARIGDGVVLFPGVYVGHDSEIGDGTVIHPLATVCERVKIGRRCIIHTGVVVGGDGFSFVTVDEKHRKIPHTGTVEIDDDVEIGANTTVARAVTGVTRVGAGTKMDGLVRVGADVELGPNCLVGAQVSIGDGATIGRGVTLATQSGVAAQVKIGDGAVVGAQSMVASSLSAGALVSGTPARPHPEEMRVKAASRRMPELIKRLHALEEQVGAGKPG